MHAPGILLPFLSLLSVETKMRTNMPALFCFFFFFPSPMSFGVLTSGPLFVRQVPYKWSCLPASEGECHSLEQEEGGSKSEMCVPK